MHKSILVLSIRSYRIQVAHLMNNGAQRDDRTLLALREDIVNAGEFGTTSLAQGLDNISKFIALTLTDVYLKRPLSAYYLPESFIFFTIEERFENAFNHYKLNHYSEYMDIINDRLMSLDEADYNHNNHLCVSSKFSHILNGSWCFEDVR